MGRHQGALSKRGVPEEAGSAVGLGQEAGAAELQEEGGTQRDRERVWLVLRSLAPATESQSQGIRGGERVLF